MAGIDARAFPVHPQPDRQEERVWPVRRLPLRDAPACPIGGLPLEAFIASDRVAEAFDAGDHYTTFGRNKAASCVAGLAAIEAIEREQLIQNAAELGQLMLQELRNRLRPVLWAGGVCGQGLLLGWWSSAVTPAKSQSRIWACGSASA